MDDAARTSESPPLPVGTRSGWYLEPSTGRQRFWDGIQWAFYAESGAASSPASGGLPRGQANGFATASLVMGILGVFLCTFFVFSVLATTFGAIGLRRSIDRGGAGRQRAIAGLVLGIVVLVMSVAFVGLGLATNW